MASTAAVRLWGRTDLRARWKSLVVLGVIAGLTAGLAAASYDGASRTSTALSRLEDRGNASDAVVFATQVEQGFERRDWSALAARPEVEQLARWRLVFGLIDGAFEVLFAASDDVWLQQVDRPIVIEGRMFDPAAPDEAVMPIFPGDEELNPYHLGDVVRMETFGQLDPETGEPASAGPTIEVRIVGIVKSSLAYEFTPGLYASPGLVAAYDDQILYAENAVVQLRNGEDDIVALRRSAAEDVAPGVPVLDLQVTARRVTATTDVEQAMLALLAAIVAVAGLVFVGQALSRSAATIRGEAPTLRALGMTRRELATAALRPHAVTAATAAIVTAVTTIIASRWFPVGIAAHVDPDRGIRVDVVTIVCAVVAVLLVVASAAAAGGWSAVADDDRRARRRPSLFSRIGLIRPLPVGIGVRAALADQSDGRRSNGRSALVGAVAAVAGGVAIITLNHGLSDSLTHPEVAGVAWDATVTPFDDYARTEGAASSLDDLVAAQPGIAAIGTIGRLVADIGDLGVPIFTAIPHGDDPAVELVTLSGRPPRTDDEITLGPSTARDLGVGIGDTVQLSDGRDATVVGFGLFPHDVHAQFDEGAQVTTQRWSGLLDDVAAGAEWAIAVRFSDRGDIDAQVASLTEAIGDGAESVGPAEVPDELANLDYVRRLPQVLAAFLAILGIVAVGHALFSTVRRRRKELAVLRALGLTPPATRLILAAHGTVVAVVGLAAGVPLGLVGGRAGWRAITDRVPLTFRSPVTAVAIVLVVPFAILVANVLALVPGRRAAKLEPAIVLRSE